MNHLILASSFAESVEVPAFQKEASQAIKDAGTIALILAAGDFRYTDSEGRYVRPDDWIEKDTRHVESLGGVAEYVDLRSRDVSAEDLERFGGFWVGGGNAFVLMRQLQESGADGLIRERFQNQRLLYIAESAGAVAAANTIDYMWKIHTETNVIARHFRELLAYGKLSRKPDMPIGFKSGLGITDIKMVPHQGNVDAPARLIQEEGNVVYLPDGDHASSATNKIIRAAHRKVA